MCVLYMKLKKQKKVSKLALKKVRYQVKNALEKRAKVTDHRPTVAQCQSWFNILNKGLFENSLKMPPFYIRRLKDCWGQCICAWDARVVKVPEGNIPHIEHHSIEYYIDMNYKYPTWKDFVETLAHEMIHLWQMTIKKDKTANHNKSFYSWRSKLQKLNLGLTL